MTWQGFLQIFLTLGLILAAVPLAGAYFYRVFNGKKTWLDPVLLPIERLIYKICSINPRASQRWHSYCISLLSFNFLAATLLFLLFLLQKYLPLNPEGVSGLGPFQAMISSLAIISGSSWQCYKPEAVLSHLSHMAGITAHSVFVRATAIAVCVALVRAITGEKNEGIGNFWVDATRSILWILLPLCVIGAILFSASGTPQNFLSHKEIKTLEQKTQIIPQGPVASQVAANLVSGTGGNYYNSGLAHPYENPNQFSNYLSLLLMIIIPAGMIGFFGSQSEDKLQSWAIMLIVMVFLTSILFVCFWAENQKNPLLGNIAIDQTESETNAGGNMEGKELRFGVIGSVLSSVISAATGGAFGNSALDSFNPISILALHANIALNGIILGEGGTGLCRMIAFILIAVFLSNLLAGRNPQYLDKKIEPREIRYSALLIAIPILAALSGILLTMLMPDFERRVLNPGPHGISQTIFNYGSAALGGGGLLNGFSPTGWQQIIFVIVMLIGHYSSIFFSLGLAVSLAEKPKLSQNSGMIETNTTPFVITLFVLLLMFASLTALPFFALGSVAEYLAIEGGKSF